jgi:hypothetical protein
MPAIGGDGESARRDSEHRRSLTSWLATSGSAIALLVSGLSLWETVLKQPQLKVYVGETMFYTRDPWGSYDVFVVPVTIVNSGAQDGAVTSLKLDLSNNETGVKDTFESAYTADATWFSGSDNVTNRTKRPKSPFSALSIAGRSAWSGTILFYSAEYREKRVAEPRSQLTGEINLTAVRTDGWLDRLMGHTPSPIKVAMTVPNYLPGALLAGDVARLRVGLNGAVPPPPPPMPQAKQ